MVKYFSIAIAFLLVYVALIRHKVRGSGDDVIAHTEYGDVRGVNTGRSLAFLGVPYAAAPVGNLRWRPPQEPKKWSPFIRNTTTVQPGCPQKDCLTYLPQYVCPTETSEDCLYLNIWTPLSAAPGTNLPVMLYIHGGSFIHISGGAPLFNGDYFAMKGQVILVNMEYRLGLLGYLYTGDGPDDANGNYGIHDQRLAMAWVRNNIGNFGGDPTKVTLFGQSAGAQSVLIHMVSDKSEGFFRNAILESDPLDIPYKSRSEAKQLGADAAKLLQCDVTDIECLRSKSLDEISAAQIKVSTKFTSFKLFEIFEAIGPFIDGLDVPLEPMDASLNDKIRKMPTIIGTNTQECQIFVHEAWNRPLTESEYIASILAAFPTHVIEILKKYPPPKGSHDLRDASVQMSTDFMFTCPARNVSRNLLKFDNNAVYRYVFDHAFEVPGVWGNFSFCEQHVCHGEEIAFVFGTDTNATVDETALSDQMISYWTNFAYTSDPNVGPHHAAINWPGYDPQQTTVMNFLTPNNKLLASYRGQYCDFWDLIGYSA